MKKKTVVLCDLCGPDRLAVRVVHWGLCEEHDLAIHGSHKDKLLVEIPKKVVAAKVTRPGTGKGYAKRLHTKCGREIDPRGWSKHIAACKGKQ